VTVTVAEPLSTPRSLTQNTPRQISFVLAESKTDGASPAITQPSAPISASRRRSSISIAYSDGAKTEDVADGIKRTLSMEPDAVDGKAKAKSLAMPPMIVALMDVSHSTNGPYNPRDKEVPADNKIGVTRFDFSKRLARTVFEEIYHRDVRARGTVIAFADKTKLLISPEIYSLGSPQFMKAFDESFQLSLTKELDYGTDLNKAFQEAKQYCLGSAPVIFLMFSDGRDKKADLAAIRQASVKDKIETAPLFVTLTLSPAAQEYDRVRHYFKNVSGVIRPDKVVSSPKGVTDLIKEMSKQIIDKIMPFLIGEVEHVALTNTGDGVLRYNVGTHGDKIHVFPGQTVFTYVPKTSAGTVPIASSPRATARAPGEFHP
jgi:hypothetical protein